jgi:hypothetical protein
MAGGKEKEGGSTLLDKLDTRSLKSSLVMALMGNSRVAEQLSS